MTQHTIRIHAPTLHNMSPDYRLLNMDCPRGKDGHCNKCHHFGGVKFSNDTAEEDRVVFAHGSYEGICEEMIFAVKRQFIGATIYYYEDRSAQVFADLIEQKAKAAIQQTSNEESNGEALIEQWRAIANEIIADENFQVSDKETFEERYVQELNIDWEEIYTEAIGQVMNLSD